MNIIEHINHPDQLKLELRRQNRIRELTTPSRCYEEAMERMRKTYTQYEQVNIDFCPDDPVYSIINSAATLSTSADTLTTQAGASGQNRILEILIGGESTASAVNRIYIQRAGTSITSNSAITPEKFNSRSATQGGTYGKAGTQALSGNPMLIISMNTFGGLVRWMAQPGEELYGVNSEVISMRSNSGTSVVSATIVVEEL